MARRLGERLFGQKETSGAERSQQSSEPIDRQVGIY